MKAVNSEATRRLQQAIFETNGDIFKTFEESEAKKALKKSSQVPGKSLVAGVRFELTTFGL